MDHLTLKALPVTMTDQGVFEAVISTETVDREKDIVRADAMVMALKKWPRPIPLAWEHSTDPDDIFGSIEPMTVRNVDGEVHAGGTVDLETKVGQDAWRSFKARSLGFSFGYLLPDGGWKDRDGGGREITELDVFEITACRAPMNNETRVTLTKNAEALAEQEVDAETLRKQADEAERKMQDDLVENAAEGLPKPEVVEEEPAWAKAIAGLEAQVCSLVEQRETKSAEDVRREAAAAEKKLQDESVEAASEDLPEPEPVEEPPPEWAKAVEDLTTKLDTLAARVEQEAKSANQPSDPELASLRKTADATALRVLSGGEHLSKPPEKVEEPKPDLPPLGEIRQKSRDVMLAVLSDQPIEEKEG